ncbi:HAD family hydrolase [Pediococcus inopinatus]|uniref:HAD family hydrolase n=1 Tax=Pediococcus inopinatus TaxID=114090 RepID=UPI00070E83A7|nr:HAD family phosphatase [Pediococcus inopinatus]AVK99184.1 hypothetical protein PI20285_00155 [Pediococcus inopinatus]KRN60922.1 beta-phosphoglucomutase [Pediococcus inopinatus]
MIKNIIFDFNGTIIFDNSIQKQAWLEVLADIAKKKVTENEFALHVAGRTNRDTFEYFLQTHLTEKRLRVLSNKKEMIYQQMCLEDPVHFKLVTGLPEFLDWCISNDININIATASELDNLKFFFTHLNLSKWFNIKEVAYSDGSLPGKPAPDIFLSGMRKIKAKPSESLIIEDSPSGILAARNASALKVVQISDNHTRSQDFGADLKINNYLNLSNVIEQN